MVLIRHLVDGKYMKLSQENFLVKEKQKTPFNLLVKL